jgi:hypothetical protein
LARALDAFIDLLEPALEHESIIIAVRVAIEEFVRTARKPAVYEPGQEPILVQPESFALELEGGRLVLQAWDRERNLVRKVTGIAQQTASHIELTIERFGKRTGTLTIADLERPAAQKKTARSSRLVFREWLRRALARQFAGWRIAEISAEADLQRSLSPAYVRAFLTRGAAGLAVLGAPEPQSAGGALTFGLIWLDHLRRRHPRITVEGLVLVVPEGSERTACLRIRCLDGRAATYTVIVYAGGYESRIDIADAGNLDTKLPSCDSEVQAPDWTDGLETLDGVERVGLPGSTVSWRVRGLEFAHWNGKELRFGIETRHVARASDRWEIESLAREIARVRRAGASDLRSPLYAADPERWLEAEIRKCPSSVDAVLVDRPLYGQVPSFAASERGVLDMLAVGHDGRLAVLEVKVSEDLHLPLQALDYWMRVRHHASAGDFARSGFFSGRTLRLDPPRLFLIAPALCFHPTTETVLRFFSSDVEVVRIGVGMGWRSGLRVVFRACGCDEPSRCEDNTETQA